MKKYCILTTFLLIIATLNISASGNLMEKINQAYDSGDVETCAELYTQLIEQGSGNKIILYNAACCHALAGNKGVAFQYLNQAMEAGYRDIAHARHDADLDGLHDDPRWEDFLQSLQDAKNTYLKSINIELYRMFSQDQADRQPPINWEVVTKRDEERRTRAWEMIRNDSLKVADDYFHAAIILQHGRDSTDYHMAYQLASKAAELDTTHNTAKWLSAAAKDRYLWSIGNPQWYGTQYKQLESGKWTIQPIDTTAVTDKERKTLNVPPLSYTRNRLKKMNK